MTARIAVIDDEAPTRAYLQTLLGTAGFEVQAAAGGNEGVALVEKERPDLVLVDLIMPEVDGFMVCERIRKGPAGADIQIVVLSILDGLDGKVRALELGADDYLVKPVDSRELVTRINVMLERGARLRQRGSQARGRLTVVAGAKGGIGTSTVAMNLAALHTVAKVGTPSCWPTWRSRLAPSVACSTSRSPIAGHGGRSSATARPASIAYRTT